MVFILCVSKCFQIVCFKVFQKSPICFNGFQIVCFQIMCFKVFSKISHRFQWFSCFQFMSFKVFSKFLIGFNGFHIKCFKVFSKFPIGFNDFQMMCFRVFSNNVFQSVSKISHRFQSVFKWCVSKCFQKSPIGFNDFQIVCFKVFSNYVFQSFFKNLPQVSKCFQIMSFKVFSKFLIGFNGFHIMCFKVFSNCVFQNETYGEFWKHFETYNLKIIETYGGFLRTLWYSFWKHTIWKPLKPMENFENTLKHIIWKPYWYPTELSPLRCDHWNLRFSIGTQMKHICAVMHGEKICFFHAVESIDFTTTVWSN